MKRLAAALWIAAVGLLGSGIYFSRQAGSLEESLRVAQSSGASSAMQKARSAVSTAAPAAEADSRPMPPPAPAAKVVTIDGLRIKLAPDLAPGQERHVKWSSRAPSPEANAAEAGIRVRTRYHALYSQLGLGPEQIGRFEEAMRNKNFATDVFVPLVGASPDEMARYTDSKLLMVDEVVRDTLGEAQVAIVRRYIATAELQEVADKLAVNTFASGALTARQADQLVQTCLALRSNADEPVSRVDPRTVDWEAVYGRAGNFLTAPQMTQLRAMLDQRKFDQDYSDVTGGARRPPVRNF